MLRHMFFMYGTPLLTSDYRRFDVLMLDVSYAAVAHGSSRRMYSEAVRHMYILKRCCWAWKISFVVRVDRGVNHWSLQL